MALLRVLILAVSMALGTILVGWWTVPAAALVYGVVTRGSRAPGLTAALAGALAWGGYLSVLGFGGAPIGRFGADLGAAMGLPAWGPHLATLLFPALLAGPAAWLAAQVGTTRPAPRGPGRR